MARPYFAALVLSFATFAVACGDAGRLDETCTSNSDCADGELCGTGFCGGFGLCIERPEACDEEDFDPVCGCDGLTYPNADCAAFAGIRLQEIDACVCEDNSQCLEGQFCALEDSCENPGQCLDEPETCEPVSEPVCGCDFITYDNACDAASAGVRVSAEAPCECRGDDECEANEFCDASVCDGPGFCALRNDPACEPAGPVTGCNGDLYDDRCEANQAGVRVRP